MGKYYVKSGELQGVAGAESRDKAAYKVIRRELRKWFDSLGLGELILTSERGFESEDDVETIDTDTFLMDRGLAEEFSLPLKFKAGVPAPATGDIETCGAAKIFPLDSFDYEQEGQLLELKSWGASGNGKTVHIWQVEGQPLCVDVFRFEIDNFAEVIGKKPDTEIEHDETMPNEAILRVLASSLLN